MYELCPQHVSDPHINPCEQVKEVALVRWAVRAPLLIFTHSCQDTLISIHRACAICIPHPNPPWLRQSGGAADSSSRSSVGPGIPVKLRYHSGPSFRKAATGNGPSPETERPTTVKLYTKYINTLPIQSTQGLNKMCFVNDCVIILTYLHHNCLRCTDDNTSWSQVMCK